MGSTVLNNFTSRMRKLKKGINPKLLRSHTFLASFAFPTFILMTIGTSLLRSTEAKITVDVLQRFPVASRPMTISGFSTGGMMASQVQVAFSKSFDGAAAFSSMWYRCAPYGNLFYNVHCKQGIYPVDKGIEDAKTFAQDGTIDKLSNLKNQKYYHWIANKDESVKPFHRLQTKTFYEGVGMKPSNIMVKQEPKAYFSMPTANKSEPSCSMSVESQSAVSNYIGISYCAYYGAYEGLRFLLGDALISPVKMPRPIPLQPIRLFDQSVFLSKDDQSYLDPVGFYYVPTKCKTANYTSPCRVHMVLHDCLGSRSNIMTAFVKRSGYLEVAEVNSIIMLFPQSTAFDGNKDACWDVFGASDEKIYATKEGVQMAALAKMLETVTGKKF